MENKIRFLRRSENFNLTQDELAKALNVSRQTIVALENGREPSGTLMLKIAGFFNKDPREIFFANNVVYCLQERNNSDSIIELRVVDSANIKSHV